jgi:uncharacterized protein
MPDDDVTVELAALPRVVAHHAAARPRRRWPWVVIGAMAVGVILGAMGGVWYLSGLIGDGVRVDREGGTFPLEVSAAEGGAISYSGSPGAWGDQGLMGIATIQGGYVQTDDPVPSANGDPAKRQVVAVALQPAPSVGDHAAMDGWYFPRNPKIGLGRDYEDVVYAGPLGPTPAWLIPGPSRTWVIYTHGLGATPREGLRIARTTTELGYPTLLIRYRNDGQAPAGSGYGQFGADEWQDLDAAVQYAIGRGAERVVLAGTGMGGAITLAFLQNSPLVDRVAGAFLDSPVADLAGVVEARAADRGIPALVTRLAGLVAAWRFGLDWEAMDYATDAAGFTTPMVIVQGAEDALVPPLVNADFAAAVTLELFPDAGHAQSWNVDRPRYERALSDFLGRVAPLG